MLENDSSTEDLFHSFAKTRGYEAGNEVIPCIYYDLKPFSGGKANVQKEKDGKWIFTDVNGKEVN
jgi:hypothetical protein